MEFNQQSRKHNSILASSSGLLQQTVQILGNFGYRTVFLMLLSREHLGIHGLFTNILQLFSLTELGIGTAILYSMYKPVAEQDIAHVGALLHFYKRVYRLVGGIILFLGLCLYPFMETLVDASEVPSDVNLRIVYILFLAENVAGYLFAYRQSLLQADQRAHITTLFAAGKLALGYLVRAVVLVVTGRFELVLAAGIASDVTLNGLFALWIGRNYAPVIAAKGEVPKEERRVIYKHTLGLMCHKVGAVVVNGTDNIVLTKFVSLAATGMYSNYATITMAVTNVANRIFWGIIPSATNYTLSRPKEDVHKLFQRVLFANLWFASFSTVCLFLLLNPFVELWLDASYLFETHVVAVLCLQHYITVARLTANIFVNSMGLFSRDKIRPLIESALNLGISILLVLKIGIAGVFVGTCVSALLTYFWREPYLVYRNFFGKGFGGYWISQTGWALFTLAICAVLSTVTGMLPNSLPGFAGKVMVVGLGSNALILLVTFRSESCRYFLDVVFRRVRRLRK